MQKQEAVPVKIEGQVQKVPRPVYDRIKTYSEITGIPVARVIKEALNDWMDAVGDVRVETLTATPPFEKMN